VSTQTDEEYKKIDLMSNILMKTKARTDQYSVDFIDKDYKPDIIIGNCIFPGGVESISISEFSQARPISIPTVGTNAVLSTGANDISIIVT